VRRALPAALATALLAIASFPPLDLGLLAYVALVPLLAAPGAAARPFLAGWLAGTIASAGICWWVVYAMTHYGGIPWLVAGPLVLLMAAAMGLFWGVFAWARALLRRRLPAVPDLLVAPALWTALEYGRAVLPDIAFPWALLGHTQYNALHLIQAADLFGVWGVSFLVVLVNAAVAAALGRAGGGARARLAPAALAAALLAAAWGYGAWRLDQPELGRTVRVAVVQGDIPQDVKWDPAFKEETFRVHEALTREAAARGTDLAVWSESSIAMYYQYEPLYQRRLADLARETRLPLLFGSPARVDTPAGRAYRNRAYLLDARGEVAGWQDKRHLVPFGEYVPWKKALFFARPLVQAVGEFTPGEASRVLEVPAARLGTLICYEAIFPDLARRFAAGGAELLLNITNDAWYERTAASRQQFVNLVFRAVENRRPVARAANTGISGFVDAKGRILSASPLFVRGQYAAALTLSGRGTVYTAWGDWFPRACALAAAGLLLAAGRGRRGPAPRSA
jgi:apolipoprotein N-acyltransferase